MGEEEIGSAATRDGRAMTASIDQKRHAAHPPEAAPDSDMRKPNRLIRGVRAFVALTALAGVVCLSVAFTLAEWRTALAGCTLVIVSAIASVVWAMDCLLADREAFFFLGELDGWMRGWRGQEPRGASERLLRR